MIRSFLHGLTGCFGFPAAENPTQAMIEPAYAALGLNWRYLTLEVRPEQLADAVHGARAMNWKGFNCTIPHKITVIEYLDDLSEAARLIGAVNCVAIRDGRLLGDNTDGKGFVQSVQAVRPVEGLKCVVLGAGGAARAIAVELALAGAARVTIVNRTIAKAESLAQVVRKYTVAEVFEWSGDFRVPADTDVLVNATSIGLYPDVNARVPVDVSTFRQGLIVCDVIPNPPRTRLVRDAESAGCTALDGLGMLVNQGVIGIKLWTGLDADPTVMRRALEEVFGT
jgi:shikimate dehydrogenase